MNLFQKVSLLLLLVGITISHAAEHSIARFWNEALMDAIRIDYPAPTVHSRNLFHLSAAMYDVWCAYEKGPEVSYLVDLELEPPDPTAALHESISYAAYRILTERFSHSPGADVSLAAFDSKMVELGYDSSIAKTEGDSPAAVGNRIGAAYLAYFLEDGSNEAANYEDNSGYEPVNPSLVLSFPGTNIEQPNFWQPLAFEHLVLQNGIVVGEAVQEFLGSHWGDVWAFAQVKETPYNIHLDPGSPPLLGGVGDAEFREAIVQVIAYSSALDPDNQTTLDISPASIGNNTKGKNDGSGHLLNPATGLPYEPNVVRLGDYGRILAEFWADGPDSETPPGHWNTLANYVSGHPLAEKRIRGTGDLVDDLEWDIKLYFILNGALHDAAIAAWDAKEAYDYVRPISIVRYMGGLGQSSNPEGISYHPDGLPLVSGLIEVISFDTMGPGQRHEHLANHYGEMAIYTWKGQVESPESGYSGVGWIRAVDWFPYQRDTFVTPPFAGYVSGHSTFSRAGAEVMTAFTGSLFFPGGIGTFTAPENEYLEFELGPTETIVLQWATYYDAADEAGISRLYGGIHVSADDLQGRIMGSRVGLDAFDLAMQYFDGLVINSHPRSQYLPPGANTILSIEAKGENLTYQWFKDGEPVPGANASYFDPGPVERLAYYHVDVQGEGGVVTSLPCHLSPTIFHADLNLGNGNRSSPWLGRFNDLHFPFVNHPGHGWIYCAFEDSAGGWLYHYGLGWCWTSSTEYPYIYVLGRNDWLLYVTGTEDPAWYYSFDNGSWLNF